MTEKKSKKIPKKIKVGPFDFSITSDKKSFDNYGLKVKDLEAVGYTDDQQLNIHIAPGLSPGAEREVCLHETFHAMYYLMGLDLALGPDKEELIVNAFGVAMLQVIRDNPGLIEYLQQKE